MDYFPTKQELATPPLQSQRPHQQGKRTARKRPSQESIARRAYAIYERNGRQQNQSVENWLQAERELKNHFEKVARTKASGKPVTSQRRRLTSAPAEEESNSTKTEPTPKLDT